MYTLGEGICLDGGYFSDPDKAISVLTDFDRVTIHGRDEARQTIGRIARRSVKSVRVLFLFLATQELQCRMPFGAKLTPEGI
jgi:hypothetical protein